MLLLLAASACTSHPNGGGDDDGTTPPDGTTTATGPDVVVPLEDIPTFVSVDAGWTLDRWAGPAFEDLDGDGIVDLLVSLVGTGTNAGAWSDLIVRGPLDDVHVPSDAWVVTDGRQISLEAVELTGDDHADLLVSRDAGATLWLVPYAFDGSLEPDVGWIDLSWTLPYEERGLRLDLNGDDTLDRIRETFTDAGDEQVEVTWGPVGRWTGSPDVTVTPFCRVGDDYGQFYTSALDGMYFPGDLDGDGLDELLVPPYGSYDHVDCGDFLVSLPSSGVLDPFTSPRVADRLGYLWHTPIGDWNGDGLPELWDAVEGTILLSPITLATDGVHGAGTVTPSSTLVSVTPLSFDLDGDGRQEALAQLGQHVFVTLPMELDALADPEAEIGWDLQTATGTLTYVDRGHAWLVVIDPYAESYQRVDLGPATAL